MNLENLNHGFCAKRPNLSIEQAVFSESTWFERYDHFCKLGLPRFTITTVFSNVPYKWICPAQKEIESSYYNLFHVM
jgi:hypothetical protein